MITSTFTSEKHEAAVRYVEMGYRVFPCWPPHLDPSNGKERKQHKAPATGKGLLDASGDIEQINRWWAANPNYNIGLVTEGLFVIDVDKGSDWLTDDIEDELQDAPKAHTPNEGVHYFFRQTPGSDLRNTTNSLAKHVDTRANGGYVVVEPSESREAKYQFTYGRELPYRDELETPPAWVIDALDKNKHQKAGKARSRASTDKFTSGERNDSLFREACRLRRNGLSVEAIKAALQVMNRERCEEPLNEEEVDSIADSAGRYDDEPCLPSQPSRHVTDPDLVSGPILQDLPGYRYFQEDHSQWDGAAYRFVSDREFAAKVRPKAVEVIKAETQRRNEWLAEEAAKVGEVLDPKKLLTQPSVTRATVSNVVGAMEGERLVSGDFIPPCWLDRRSKPDPRNVIATPSGLFDVLNPDAGLIPPTPEFFTFNAVGYDIDRRATCPLWLDTICGIFEGDKEQISAVQEWTGYLLTSDNSLERIALFQGESRGGKSTITDTWESLFGRHSFASIQPTEFSGPFGLQSILHKSCVVIADMRVAREHQQAFLGRLLSISGNDSLTVNRKNKPAVDAKLGARLTIVTNEPPDLADSTDALCRRLLPIRFTKRFTSSNGRDDSRKHRLRKELPGILNWAIEGLQRLRVQGNFTETQAGQELLRAVEQTNSPIRTFAEDVCEVGSGLLIEKAELYAAFKRWCGDNAMPLMTLDRFAQKLMAAYPAVSPSRPRRDDGQRVQCFGGIQLRPVHGTQNTIGGDEW